MGWASRYIQKLRAGEPVSFRPHGQSMTGRIESGQLCTVVPIDPAMLEVGDIVLCKVAGNEYLHIVRAIQNNRYQIGNNRGFINGWIGPEHIYGKCVKVQPWAMRWSTLRRSALVHVYSPTNERVPRIRGFRCNRLRGCGGRGSRGSRQERAPFRVDRQHGTNRFLLIQTQVRRKHRHDELHRRGVIVENLHPTLEPQGNEFGE
jgi:hypothetical protein